MTVTEFLQTKVPFLSGIDNEQARTLAVAAEQLNCRAGQTVLFQGVTVEGLHVVALGKVSVWVKPSKSRSAVEVAQLGPGEVFGETSIIEMGTAGATVKADQDETLIFVIPQDVFHAVLDQHPEIRARAEALIAARRKPSAPGKPAA
ncbi:MAG: cyclic nucleotide-binding domain-containing protein [Elusimicrobia bacterium]|nr:cyclic nucleotide-binding domain-containing protein [Elusimicrobiota bacterium]